MVSFVEDSVSGKRVLGGREDSVINLRHKKGFSKGCGFMIGGDRTVTGDGRKGLLAVEANKIGRKLLCGG
ncbi:hypothetical protein TSUD_160790 [Trifolium subterraneum]|uniref:Uncharacterized protein n=1 Tax=Trifolium subterraneum TaxID=3900 RepID=A0A2Z6MBG8_TRISU|nr:hypothetical protein TSUD_160790 [Trifolium subterraneum]